MKTKHILIKFNNLFFLNIFSYYESVRSLKNYNLSSTPITIIKTIKFVLENSIN